MNNEIKKERLLELLADQAIFELNKEELNELENLNREFPNFADNKSFDAAVSAIFLSEVKAFETMPESLYAKLSTQASEYFPQEIEVEGKLPETENDHSSGDKNPKPLQGTINDVAAVEEPRISFMQWLGWGFAAAACLALIANIWFTRIEPDKPTAEKQPTAAEQKQQLLASAEDVVKRNWTSPQEGENLSGEIVWSNSQQKGFTTFRGLPTNDPNKETYQLWIFDETQGETPINGGVFNVDKNGEVTIPVDPGINVKKPKQFAVTVEKPGGVVVSKQEKIVAVAKV